MTVFFSKQLHGLLIVLGLAGYIAGKEMPANISTTLLYSATESGPSPIIAQAIFSGPSPGLAADANLLSIFNAYDHILKLPDDKKQSEVSWHYLMEHLQHASILDPYFYDTYRLTSGLLAFQNNYTRDALNILKHGAANRTWDWETPLVAGFLAHDLLHDDRLAFDFMKQASSRPGAPPLVMGLAARFLADVEGAETGLQFLRYMKSIMPKGYSKPIDDRIKMLEKEWQINP